MKNWPNSSKFLEKLSLIHYHSRNILCRLNHSIRKIFKSYLFPANVIGYLHASGERYTKNDKDHIKLSTYKIDVNIGKPHLQFDHIFGNNKELNDQTNKIINENVETIVEEVKPVVIDVITQFVFGIANRVFDRYSFDELFPK